MSTKLTDAEKNQIIKFHVEDGLNTVSISKKIGRGQNTVEKFLKLNGYYRGRTSIELNSNEIDSLITLYNSGKTGQEICDLFNGRFKSCDAVTYILKKYGVKLRKGVRRSVIANHDFFKVIDSEYKAYFLGLMIADGCVQNIRKKSDKEWFSKSISLELSINDRYILDEFAKCLVYTGKIHDHYKNDELSTQIIRFASSDMFNDLETYGVIPNKSKIETYLPIIDPQLMRHLIRGIFDGDGTVYIGNNKFNWGFYGSYRLCNEISEFLKINIFSNNSMPSVFNKGTVSFIYLHSKFRTPIFFNYLYKDATIYMKRKKEKFEIYYGNTEINKGIKNPLSS